MLFTFYYYHDFWRPRIYDFSLTSYCHQLAENSNADKYQVGGCFYREVFVQTHLRRVIATTNSLHFKVAVVVRHKSFLTRNDGWEAEVVGTLLQQLSLFPLCTPLLLQ